MDPNIIVLLACVAFSAAVVFVARGGVNHSVAPPRALPAS